MKLHLTLIAIVLAIFQLHAADWPKVIDTKNGKATIYQPQLDSLIGDK